MSIEGMVVLMLVIFLIGILPAWPYSHSWGYAPMGVFAVVLIVVLLWVVTGDRQLFKDVDSRYGTTLHDAGTSMKSMGRDVAESIRDVAQ